MDYTELEERKNRLMELFLSPQYQPLKIKEIAILLDIPKNKRQELEEVLTSLLMEHKIEVTSHGKYLVAKQALHAFKEKQPLLSGTFCATQKGFGFVTLEDGQEDIFIAKEDVNGAFPDDLVKIEIIQEFSKGHQKTFRAGETKRRVGRIVAILKRARENIVGTFVQTKQFAFVVPDDTKFYKDIFIDKSNFNGAVNGHKVVVQLLNYGAHGKNPEGRVMEILGHKNDPGVDILSVVKALEIPTTFPKEVMEQVQRIPDHVLPQEIATRRDLRASLTVTIDGEDAKDLDDAISLTETKDGGYDLGVHIADVSHYIPEDSPLDCEARKRGTSVYLVDRVIPMLPHRLSNGICSLNAGEDRLALSCLMHLDSEGNVLDHEVCETVIRVDRRMSYPVVAELLSDHCEEDVKREYADYISFFQRMEKLSAIIRSKRQERGAIDFDFPEAKILLDEKGRPKQILPYERNVATKIIEDFMLTANETIAEAFFWQNIPFLYRVHEAPEEKKMLQLSSFLAGFGCSLHVSNHEVHPKKLQKIINALEGTPESMLVSRVMLRAMKQARYSTDNIGHFGLSAQYYTHFTSPIRRYPDLQIHRIIKEFLHTMSVREEHFQNRLPDIAQTSSKTERRAEEAEREVLKKKKAQYMVKHLGEEYDGIISGVTSWGIFIELENTVEGLVRLQDLQDDYYVFDEKHYCVIGDLTRCVYRLGQKVRIMVQDVDTDLATVSFRMLSHGIKQGGVFS